MQWIYGKQDWKTLERGQENCFLMTNHLGGFSSVTMLGSVTRNDHALLMACTKAPNHRYNMLHCMTEKIKIGEKEYVFSSQEFADGRTDRGYKYLSCFSYEDTPAWRFQVEGVEICKEMAMKRDVNAIGIRYRIVNRGKERCVVNLTPFFQFTLKGEMMEKNQKISKSWEKDIVDKKKCIRGKLSSNGITLYFRTNGEVQDISEKTEIFYYDYDACDGRRKYGQAIANHKISIDVEPSSEKELDIIYEMELSEDTAEQMISEMKGYRKRICKEAGYQSEIARMLSKSADQFIAKRESTGGETILAGFPFFTDWGRDTMIALPGLCISTKRYDVAKSILRTFAANEKNGLMPNLFPEGESQPMYNTVDAALLFINCVYLYYCAERDEDFVREMYPVMERIVEKYCCGTEFGIHMDTDGLLLAGEGLAQVTWMDVRVGEILPTPRHGKPVEVNAYWYNALRIMEIFADIVGSTDAKATGYKKMSERVKESFEKKFWMGEKGYLRDVISGTKADEQMRCNQIWAVSMPFTMLDREKEMHIVDAVFEKLYTPYGLRTLEKNDSEFHPIYKGTMYERDMAYHQGTVWNFPLGGYYMAYLKVNDYSEKAKSIIREQLMVMESVLREGCIGQIPEIYDGGNPVSSKGCFAQAWSVGEMLRVYEAIEKM